MSVWIGMSLKSKAHGFCFYPRINICAFADWRSDLRSVAYDFLNKSSESMLVFLVKFWRWFDQRLSDISSERDSESDTQH